MLVHVKLYGTLRRFSQPGTPGRWRGEIQSDTRLIDLIYQIGSNEREVSAATIDGRVQPLATIIPDDATEIVLVTPVGGG